MGEGYRYWFQFFQLGRRGMEKSVFSFLFQLIKEAPPPLHDIYDKIEEGGGGIL